MGFHAKEGGFQPTLPARGATRAYYQAHKEEVHFNPRSPHGERRRRGRADAHHKAISTHAPRTGSDCKRAVPCQHGSISTHAPRTGSDPKPLRKSQGCIQFQPTLPARGATSTATIRKTYQRYFNPRSPHGERLARGLNQSGRRYFNPRSPHGERPSSTHRKSSPWCISTHAPRTGSDSAK